MASVKRAGSVNQTTEKNAQPNYAVHPGYLDNGAPKGKAGKGGKMAGKPAGKRDKMC